MKIALVLEGPGDLQAYPTLVAKTAQMCGMQIHAPNPIRAGCFEKLRKPGELERYLRMAASRPDIDAVVICIDLDDQCPVTCRSELESRAKSIEKEYNKRIEICLCEREYEAWILHNIEEVAALSPDYGWVDGVDCRDPLAKRDAKGILNGLMSRHYKEITDQLALTRKLNPQVLYRKSRSFRRFAKAITGCEYDVLELAL